MYIILTPSNHSIETNVQENTTFSTPLDDNKDQNTFTQQPADSDQEQIM